MQHQLNQYNLTATYIEWATWLRSGMLPGHIAGHYTYDECHVDLSLLATFAKARLIVAKAENIDFKVQ